jgi:hypothetical protein
MAKAHFGRLPDTIESAARACLLECADGRESLPLMLASLILGKIGTYHLFADVAQWQSNGFVKQAEPAKYA